MQKIDFVNATHPAINDTNLNLMQDNIETAINAQVSGDTLPLGAILPFPGGTIPDNYLLCDGSAVSRTTYALLFNVIGTTYGEGDGSTTFNLPDMRSRTLVGADTRDSNLNAVGKTYGEKKHTMTINELVSHTHREPIDGGTNSGDYLSYGGYGNTRREYVISGSAGGGQPFNVMQPSMATNYIIKAFQTAGVVAQVVNEHSTSTLNVYSCNYVNKFKPEAIYCNLSADVQMTNNYYNISNWSQVKKVGDGFSISSGKIHIGAGINTIKITVKVGVGVNANSLFYSYIIKNSGNLTESREIHYIRASEPQIVYNQAVTSVSEGDVITISHYGDGTIMRESTSIIVEKID